MVSLPTDNTRYFFYILLGLVLYMAFAVIMPFFGAITLAFLTAVMSSPIWKFFKKRFNWRDQTASLATLLAVMVMFILPTLLMVQMTISQLLLFSSDLTNYTREHEITLEMGVEIINGFRESLPFETQALTVEQARSSLDEAVNNLARLVLDRAVRTTANSLEILTQVFTYLFLVFFLLPVQSRIPELFARLSPLKDEIDYMFINKALAMAQSMIKGTVVIALVQALAGGLLLWLMGAPYIAFLIMLMIFLGIIPVVGASTVLIPAGLIFISLGQIWQGLFVLVVTLVVIANLDHLLRPRLVSKEAELHPALILIGVLGGLKAFGVMGVIYGPVIMIVLTTMLSLANSPKVVPKN